MRSARRRETSGSDRNRELANRLITAGRRRSSALTGSDDNYAGRIQSDEVALNSVLRVADGPRSRRHWTVASPARSRLRAPKALARLAMDLSQGRDVVLLPASEEISPAAAARILGMSRPHLCKLLDAGAIPHTRVGRDRRINVEDVSEFLRKRELARCELAERVARNGTERSELVARLAGVDLEYGETPRVLIGGYLPWPFRRDQRCAAYESLR